jgi:hypothetical protein
MAVAPAQAVSCCGQDFRRSATIPHGAARKREAALQSVGAKDYSGRRRMWRLDRSRAMHSAKNVERGQCSLRGLRMAVMSLMVVSVFGKQPLATLDLVSHSGAAKAASAQRHRASVDPDDSATEVATVQLPDLSSLTDGACRRRARPAWFQWTSVRVGVASDCSRGPEPEKRFTVGMRSLPTFITVRTSGLGLSRSGRGASGQQTTPPQL